MPHGRVSPTATASAPGQGSPYGYAGTDDGRGTGQRACAKRLTLMSVRAGGSGAPRRGAPGSAVRSQEQHERDKHQRCPDPHHSTERELPEVEADESHQSGLRPPSSDQEEYAGSRLGGDQEADEVTWWGRTSDSHVSLTNLTGE